MVEEAKDEKVYIVWGWNGEAWEDSYEWIVDVYKNKESAEKIINKLNKKAERDYKKGKTFEQCSYKIKEFVLKD